MIKAKVYCKFCRFLRKDTHGDSECYHKKNRGDWRSPDPISRKPKQINMFNNCKWFELDMWHYGGEYLNAQKEKPRKSPFDNILDSDESGEIKTIVTLDVKELTSYIAKVADGVFTEREKRNL